MHKWILEIIFFNSLVICMNRCSTFYFFLFFFFLMIIYAQMYYFSENYV